MNNNATAFEQAQNVFPGGVNSPVRAFGSVGGKPLFIARGVGAKVFDIEGGEFIDYVGSWGPMILGHADKDVVDAVCKTAENGLGFGAPTLAETELAQLIQQAFPGMKKMRFVSSGTEAVMSATRLARGFTNKPVIIKCEGAYHGHADSMLVAAGSGVATLSIPGCPGIPEDIAKHTLIIPFNNAEALKKAFDDYPGKIAGFIVEPVCGNMGVVLPSDNYLQEVKKLCADNDALLIFDEVRSGFRACFGGASKIYGVEPDLTCLGKIVGGGMPLAVYGGKAEIMKYVAPDGPVYQAGTLSGNPIAVAAGFATLNKIKSDLDFYSKVSDYAKKLELELEKLASKHNIDMVSNRFGSMLTMFFNAKPVKNYKDAAASDTEKFARWFRLMLNEGIYFAPSQFEATFVSIAHKDEELSKTLQAAQKVLKEL
jgi:glutamate-1-semialdehyde 2,1-aminomutase